MIMYSTRPGLLAPSAWREKGAVGEGRARLDRVCVCEAKSGVCVAGGGGFQDPLPGHPVHVKALCIHCFRCARAAWSRGDTALAACSRQTVVCGARAGGAVRPLRRRGARGRLE